MIQVKDIYAYLDSIAPFDRAFSYDNCGLLVGDAETAVRGCILALDLTRAVLECAKAQGASLILTHHPVIFDPIRSLSADHIVYALVQSGISVIAAHTNLDLAQDGVNDALAKALGLSNIRPFINADGAGRIGDLVAPMEPGGFAVYAKGRLGAPAVSYIDCARPIRSVAVVGGEGSDYLYDSVQADAYLTGEVKGHILTYAQNAGIQLFVTGHYYSEAVVLAPLRQRLAAAFPSIPFTVFADAGISWA